MNRMKQVVSAEKIKNIKVIIPKIMNLLFYFKKNYMKHYHQKLNIIIL